MKVDELKAYLKERDFKGYSTMRKAELETKWKEFEEEAAKKRYKKELKEKAVCIDCLNQQRIQRKIDEKAYDQRLLESAIRMLVCQYCQHSDLAVDGDDTFCVKCGALQDPSVSRDKYKD